MVLKALCGVASFTPRHTHIHTLMAKLLKTGMEPLNLLVTVCFMVFSMADLDLTGNLNFLADKNFAFLFVV